MTTQSTARPAYRSDVPGVDERLHHLRRVLTGAEFSDQLHQDLRYLAYWNTGNGVARLLRVIAAAREAEHHITIDNMLRGGSTNGTGTPVGRAAVGQGQRI